MGSLLTNNSLWKQKISYYLDKEPESCFVLEDKGDIKGYLLGCLDDKNHSVTKDFLKSIILTVIGFPFIKNRIFWINELKVLVKIGLGKSPEKDFVVPKNSSHFHINLLPEVRGKGYGKKLLEKFVKYAKSKGVKTIHADSFQTSLNPNYSFFIMNDFREYCKVKTIFWKKYYPNERIYLVSYVKSL